MEGWGLGNHNSWTSQWEQGYYEDWLLEAYIGGSITWWKKALWKKYFTGTRLRCLEFQPKLKTGWPIFKLLLAFRPLISERLNWIPWSEHWINSWEDKILESDHQNQLKSSPPQLDGRTWPFYTIIYVHMVKWWHLEMLECPMSPITYFLFI